MGLLNEKIFLKVKLQKIEKITEQFLALHKDEKDPMQILDLINTENKLIYKKNKIQDRLKKIEIILNNQEIDLILKEEK